MPGFPVTPPPPRKGRLPPPPLWVWVWGWFSQFLCSPPRPPCGRGCLNGWPGWLSGCATSLAGLLAWLERLATLAGRTGRGGCGTGYPTLTGRGGAGANPEPWNIYIYIYTYIYIYIVSYSLNIFYISNCLRPSRHRALNRSPRTLFGYPGRLWGSLLGTPPGRFFSSPGLLLGPPWLPLEPFWVPLDPFWVPLGTSWTPLGPHWGPRRKKRAKI